MGRKQISVVTCAYNEEDCIDELARRLRAVFASLPEYDFEVIAVENGSHDQTFAHLETIRATDGRFKILQLARNFGFDGGLRAGMAHASGNAVVLMAADLQDPPEVIVDFVRRWEEGFENVYGLVAQREGTGPIRRFNSHAFYWLIAKLGDHPIPPHARDFRLIDRSVCDQVNDMHEHKGIVRGLVALTGARSTGVIFHQPERFAGISKASSRGLSEFAIRAIFSHSLTPIRVMPVIGLTMILGSLGALFGISVNSVVNGVPFPGFGSLVIIILLMFGVLFCFLSVIGVYVGLIYEQVIDRPNFVVRAFLGGALQPYRSAKTGDGALVTDGVGVSPIAVATHDGGHLSSEDPPRLHS